VPFRAESARVGGRQGNQTPFSSGLAPGFPFASGGYVRFRADYVGLALNSGRSQQGRKRSESDPSQTFAMLGYYTNLQILHTKGCRHE
jgi:hypothetical protein